MSVTCTRTSTPKIQAPWKLAADCLGSTVGVANYSLCTSYSEMRTNLNCGHSLIPRRLDERYLSMNLSKMTQSNFDPWLGDDDIVWSKVTTAYCYTAYLVFLFCSSIYNYPIADALLLNYLSKVHQVWSHFWFTLHSPGNTQLVYLLC